MFMLALWLSNYIKLYPAERALTKFINTTSVVEEVSFSLLAIVKQNEALQRLNLSDIEPNYFA